MLGFTLGASRRGNSEKARPIYLDMQASRLSPTPVSNSLMYMRLWQATTPLDPRVLDAMLPYMTDQYGNPHSRTHAYGWEAEQAVDDARKVR